SAPGTIVTSFDVSGGAVTKVDRLVYGSEYRAYSKRSVITTPERLYVAGPTAEATSPSDLGGSLIQGVDISDPKGRMQRGAEVHVAGKIDSRWQMDEFAGALRVVSQHDPSFRSVDGSDDPTVETFRVKSSSDVTPLGSTKLKIPQAESLRSVRFDGV